MPPQSSTDEPPGARDTADNKNPAKTLEEIRAFKMPDFPSAEAIKALKSRHGDVYNKLDDRSRGILMVAMSLRHVTALSYEIPEGMSIQDLQIWRELPDDVWSYGRGVLAYVEAAEMLTPAPPDTDLMTVLRQFKDAFIIAKAHGVEYGRVNVWRSGWNEFAASLEDFVFFAHAWNAQNKGIPKGNGRSPNNYSPDWWATNHQRLQENVGRVLPSENLGLHVQDSFHALAMRLETRRALTDRVFL